MVKAYNTDTHIKTYADWAISFFKNVKQSKAVRANSRQYNWPKQSQLSRLH